MWIKPEFCLYDDRFKAMRDKMSEKFNRCFACDWPFQVNVDMIHLACFSHRVGNKPLCKDCAKDLSDENKNNASSQVVEQKEL